jgi:hypothetical protein
MLLQVGEAFVHLRLTDLEGALHDRGMTGKLQK